MTAADHDARPADPLDTPAPAAVPHDLAGSTPGPWRVIEDSPSECTVRARGKVISGVVATVRLAWVHASQRAEQAANARLIAAAPELLTENIALRSALSKARAERDAFERVAADRLAGEVNKLIGLYALDARSPVADALLDYASIRHGDVNPITEVERAYEAIRSHRTRVPSEPTS